MPDCFAAAGAVLVCLCSCACPVGVQFKCGGFGGLFWVFIGTVICYSMIVASLAGMESMAPTSGGWMSTLGYLASVSSTVFPSAEANNANFVFERRQYCVNIGISDYGQCLQHPSAMALPRIKAFSFFGHLENSLVTIIPLLVLASKNSAKQTLTEVGNNGVSVLYYDLSSDCVVYVFENASLNVPRAMWWSFVLNVVMEHRLQRIGLCTHDHSVFLIFSGNITALAITSRELWVFSPSPSPSFALLSTYMISIGCVLSNRLFGDELPSARPSLGRLLGIPINVSLFLYSRSAIVFGCFPSAAPAVWVGVVFLVVVIYECMGGDIILLLW
ncbi:hypothetical protein BGZ57DRAFT_937975 [Hyaloscypha finlandica]|nr:hypothetical protein BGZ57DRAFT_937975 [Hyaloscypha finlandica]